MRKLKDIFVDTNLAKNFCNPVDPDLKEFIRWLFFQGALVVTNKIIAEYDASCRNARSRSSILVIVAHQTRKNRQPGRIGGSPARGTNRIRIQIENRARARVPCSIALRVSGEHLVQLRMVFIDDDDVAISRPIRAALETHTTAPRSPATPYRSDHCAARWWRHSGLG